MPIQSMVFPQLQKLKKDPYAYKGEDGGGSLIQMALNTPQMRQQRQQDIASRASAQEAFAGVTPTLAGFNADKQALIQQYMRAGYNPAAAAAMASRTAGNNVRQRLAQSTGLFSALTNLRNQITGQIDQTPTTSDFNAFLGGMFGGGMF